MPSLELIGQQKVAWAAPEGCPKGLETREVHAGRSDIQGGSPIELAIARWTLGGRVTREALSKLHALRVGQRATPVVLAVEMPDDTVITFGPNASAEPLSPLPHDQAQLLFQAVLDEPSALMARARLAALTEAIDSTAIPGVKNSGLFANHELRVGVPQREDWKEACQRSRPWLPERGTSLISYLGYSVKRAGAHALVLTGDGPRPHAIAVMLSEGEGFDSQSTRFAVSPVAYGLTMAEREGVPWLIMARGSQLRLYPARVDLGVGRKGLAETFFELDLPYLTVENAGYLGLLFSAQALADGGTAYQIMESSAQYAVALGERLRDKVYEEIIPDLSLAVAEQMIDLGYEMDAEGLDLAYQITLRIFFRLLFQVYAEDRGLLPYKENDRYTRNALKTLAADFLENPDEEDEPQSAALWDDLAQVWNVIDAGDRSWGVPAYNGGLFSSDKELHPHGALIGQLRIHNDVMGPVLRALLLDENEDEEIGAIDFRSLSVREFGTIYEGLLESSLGLAEVDLTLDDKGTWLPAKKKSDEIYAYAGQVYFHNTSGQRKGTGSYFTPSFVVEHLLERSLDPALDEHLSRVAELIAKGDQAGATDLFFDFRVADLAMGSGHFLTAAIDHIEAKMAAFLAEDGNHIPGVASELSQLFAAAKEAIGPDSPEPEPSSLLRRQIARRCIYGLDINPIAVELARVSIWIHTFVRGLPMSSLDHNLVCGNSLTGIGSVEEALDVLVPGRKGAATLFDAPIEAALESARTVLVDVANLPELNRKETQAASKAVQKARKQAETARLLFDAAVLTRIGREGLVAMSEVAAIAKAAAASEAQRAIAPLQPAHMPVLFPEVFLRSAAGFDVLVGNPPWEKLHVEEHQWWALRYPGLRGMSQKAKNALLAELKEKRPDLAEEHKRDVEAAAAARRIIASGPYDGIGEAHIDLFAAFSWRNWQLLAKGGRIGLVLPRNAFSGASNADWRKRVLSEGSFDDLCNVVNRGQWVFAGVHQQYTVTFATLSRNASGRPCGISGPFSSKEAYATGVTNLVMAPVSQLLSWSDTASVPLIGDQASLEVFSKMLESPRFRDELGKSLVPMQGDVNSTNEKSYFDFDLEHPAKELKVLTGASFYTYDPDHGLAYAYAAESQIGPRLVERANKQVTRKSSAFFGWKIEFLEDLPFGRARLTYRRTTRATDTRTAIAALMPPRVVLTEQAPFFVTHPGDEVKEAFALGILNSRAFDWMTRRRVELNLSFQLLAELPFPHFDRSETSASRVTQLAGRLAAKDDRFEAWAEAVGVPVGSVKNLDQQADMEAEIDALVSHLYGLSRDQVEHIFATFHRGWDYKPRLEVVLTHFDQIEAAR